MPHELDDITPFTWRACRGEADLDELFNLLSAIYHIDEPTQRYSRAELTELFHTAEGVEENLLLGWEKDSVVAYGWNIPMPHDFDPRRIVLSGGVHPAYRHQGIGRKLLTWQRLRARDWFVSTYPKLRGSLRMVAFADERLSTRRDLYARGGLVEQRWFLDMHCAFSNLGEEGLQTLQNWPPPEGVQVVPFSAEYAELTRDCHNAAFVDDWHARPIGEVAWAEQLSRTTARPEWSWVAFPADDRSEVIGYALNSFYTPTPEDDYEFDPDSYTEGWTDRLGVRPQWRNKGIARTLLAHSLSSFHRAGLDGGGLGIDTHGGGAIELYRSVGYDSSDAMIQYGLDETYDEATDTTTGITDSAVMRQHKKGEASGGTL